MRTSILSTLIIGTALSISAGSHRLSCQQPGQEPGEEPFTSIGSYSISFPVGDTHRFVHPVSWFGAGWEGQWPLRPQTVWGVAANINDFFDATRGTTTFPQGAATGLQNRDLLLVSGTGTIRHFLRKTTNVRPYVGIGAGGEYVQQYYQLGVNSQFTRSGFHFILAPEAGFTTPVMEGVDLLLAARYTAPTSGGNYLGGGSRRFGFVTLVFGMAER